MSAAGLNNFLRRLRCVIERQRGTGAADADLLKRYVVQGDEAAFETLVRRHGPMILGVCRRVLPNPHDAEDAFQATFLVLIRKASTLRSPAALGNWLYGVAYRTAQHARHAAIKRRAKEAAMPTRTDTPEDAWAGWLPILDREMERLPEKYRTVVVLCELQGKTRREAALLLGCAEGTVASRLSRGLALLAKRLARHGPAVTSGTLAIVLSQMAMASVPASVVPSTVKAASLYAAGRAAATGAVSVKVAALTEGVLKTMLLKKLQVATTVLMVVAALSGAAGLIYQTQAGEQKALGTTVKADKEKQPLGNEPPKTAVTPQDLVAGYKLNYYQFPRLRVSWRHVHQKREEWFRWHEASRLSLEKRAKAATSEEEKASLRTQIKFLAEQLSSPETRKPSVMLFDFWTDRKRFQIRRVATGLEQVGQTIPDDFTFPDVPLTPSSLATAFKDITILSFNGDLKAGFRYWEGRRRQDKYLGSVYSKAPDEPYQAWLFPPLGVDNQAWARAGPWWGPWYGPYSVWHKIDRFFTYPLKDMAVRGTETVGGKKTYLLTFAKVHDDLRSSLPPNLLEKYKGKARRFERMTAWIDPSQGFLPLKIEFEGYHTLEEGGKTYSTYAGPGDRLTVERVEHIPGGGFYPAKGVFRSFRTIRPVEEISNFNHEDYLRGKYLSGEKGVYEEERWEATRVEAGWEGGQDFFALAFPPTTMYWDETLQKAITTSSDPAQPIDLAADSNPAQPIDLAAGEPVGQGPVAVPEQSGRWWIALLIGSVVLVILLLMVYVGLRRRAKAKQS